MSVPCPLVYPLLLRWLDLTDGGTSNRTRWHASINVVINISLDRVLNDPFITLLNAYFCSQRHNKYSTTTYVYIFCCCPLDGQGDSQSVSQSVRKRDHVHFIECFLFARGMVAEWVSKIYSREKRARGATKRSADACRHPQENRSLQTGMDGVAWQCNGAAAAVTASKMMNWSYNERIIKNFFAWNWTLAKSITVTFYEENIVLLLLISCGWKREGDALWQAKQHHYHWSHN